MSEVESIATFEDNSRIIMEENRQRGIEILNKLGVGIDVAGVVLKGPRPECSGTLAEMIGVEGHSDTRDRIIKKVELAQNEGRDPGEAILGALEMFVNLDANGELVRVDLSEKKN